MSNRIVHGARALVHIGPKLVGTISAISYQLGFDAQDAYVLGRLSPAEITYTGQEPVSGSLSGWHVLGAGPHVQGLPALQDLLTAPYTTITVIDRVTGKVMAKIKDVRLLGASGGHSTRQLSEKGIPFKGITMSDDDVDNVEPAGSADLNIA